MPASMMHIYMAYKMNPEADSLFYIGNYAPDAIEMRKDYRREQKDVIHFRNAPDRWEALRKLAEKTDPDNSYAEGCLMHLFFDACWDTGPHRKFRDIYEKSHPSEWFVKYRWEISLVGSWLFNTNPWMNELWNKILSCMKSAEYIDLQRVYDLSLDPTCQEIKLFTSTVYSWHSENKVGPSMFYTPEFVDDFTDQIISSYIKWR